MFELIQHKRPRGGAVLVAFDLIELDGHDLRCEPIEHREALNEHYEYDGEVVFQDACKLGWEVSCRSPHRSGCSLHWVKVKNPKAPAVIGIMIAVLLVHFLP